MKQFFEQVRPGALQTKADGKKKSDKMKLGTKSVLYGAHCFFLHPWFVAWAWWKLYGFPWDPRLWVAFWVHDLGYIGKPNMDGLEGEMHPYWGACVMGALFGRQWFEFTLYHSRYLAKKNGAQYSRLCVADKLAICLTPWWIAVPLDRATGEIKEYMQLAKSGQRDNSRNYQDEKEWYLGVQEYCYAWVMEHKEIKEDTWTKNTRTAVNEHGVYQ